MIPDPFNIGEIVATVDPPNWVLNWVLTIEQVPHRAQVAIVKVSHVSRLELAVGLLARWASRLQARRRGCEEKTKMFLA